MELGLYSFDELKEMWSKKYTAEEIKKKLQAEAEKRCREAVEELDSIMRIYLMGDEGKLEDLIESALSIVYAQDTAIDLDNPHEMLGEAIEWDDTTGQYLYVVKDREGREYIGGLVCICLDFETAIDGEEIEDSSKIDEVRITDVSVWYEEK